VIAAARGERKLALARELGAALAVDYSEAGWTESVRAEIGDRDVDVVFDGAGGRIGAEAFELTGRGSRFFSYGSASGAFAGIEAAAARRGVRVVGIDEKLTTTDQRRYARAALARLAAGEIRPVIGQVVPLERAADAHAAIEERRVAGKTLLATAKEAA
jgi:NADPH2:quinone reductase